MNSLSIRLKTIASLVPLGARVCDIGTDHARLPIYLKQQNIAKTVIACDLNEKPLEFAKKNVEESGISDIEIRLGDGLSPIKENEVDTVIIAGLGGEVISDIISKCKWVKNNNIKLILQPTTSADFLRRFLISNGFQISKEIPLCENKKLYSIIDITYTGLEKTYPQHYFYVGEIKPQSPDGILYIKKQQKRVFECMNSLENIPTKQKEYEHYKSAYSGIEKLLTEN